MNERIKQLAEQAQIGLFEDKSFGWSVIAGTDQHLAKFAQLIVAECADIAKHHVMNISTYADADFVDEQIKEYFGVEE